MYRTRSRPCLLYQIGRCSGPCVQKISQEQYAQNVQSAILFLEGKNHDLIHLLKEKMDAASLAEHFEIAATYRDQMIQLRAIQEKQYVQVGSGDADIIDIEERAQMFAIQLLSMRAGCIIHSRSFPLKSPHDTTQKEAISAFISQYYLSLSSLVAENHLPKQIIVNVLPNGKRALESILTEKARHIVKIARPIRGKKLIWLKMAADSAKQALVQHTASQDAYEERWQALAQLLNVTTPLIRIECFDISHTQGESTIGSCVVFDAYGPVKRDYRYFNIVGEVGGDDLAAMHQALLRRFKRLIKTNSTLPDLLLIDGGETQLAVAHQVLSTLNLQIQLLSVSKGKARKRGEEVLHRVQMKPQRLQPDSQALHLIQYIRDEAHRFAITKHRSLRDKKRRRSRLESVPKIGPKRRQALLNYFGGIQGIARASLEELTKVPGVSRSLALDIFSVFHNETV
ncbi:MAG: hypothetical protein ACD_45C00581G0001 [uncultured bacterium]|nr:MAG: hypothetical protein ACD_45C00581G0001 [uncultured bacterium]